MRDCVCRDDRARGLLQFYGANRTGRFQEGSFSSKSPKKQDGDLELQESWSKMVTLTLSLLLTHPASLIGTYPHRLYPEKGRIFLVADYSAIEEESSPGWRKTWRMALF